MERERKTKTKTKVNPRKPKVNPRKPKSIKEKEFRNKIVYNILKLFDRK